MSRHVQRVRLSISILLCLALLNCSNTPPDREEAIPSVKYLTVGDKAQGQVRRISGKIVAAQTSFLSFAVGGTVVELLSSPGDTVVSGQVLAHLDAEPYELATERARSQLNIARTQLKERQLHYDRQVQLLNALTASESDVDVAEAELKTATENVETAQSELRRAERDQKLTVLTAPFSGAVAARDIEPFQEITPGQQIFSLQSDEALEIEVLVPETMIRDVDYGQVVQVTYPTLDGVETGGVVSEIGSQVQAGNAFPVTIQLSSVAGDLRPGMTASVTFNFDAYLQDKTIYLVPISVLALSVDAPLESRPERQEAPVFVYDAGSSTVRRQLITIGGLRGNSLEVYEGLNAGDKVVVAGVAFLKDGMRVRLWEPRHGIGSG